MYLKTPQVGVSGLRRRVYVGVAVSALTLTLALGGCRAGAAHTASPSIQQHGVGSLTNGASSTAGGSNSSLQQLQSIDSQNQSDTQQLSGAQSSAGVNYSSQESQTQP